MTEIIMKPIAYVHNQRSEIEDDFWGKVVSEIRLDLEKVEKDSIQGLEEFTHLEIIYYFDQVSHLTPITGSRHPRNNKNLPALGIFAQRAKMRPNFIGVSICKLIEVHDGKLVVQGLDAIDKTPVLDIKPVFTEFLPDKTSVKQAAWTKEIMKNYF